MEHCLHLIPFITKSELIRFLFKKLPGICTLVVEVNAYITCISFYQIFFWGGARRLTVLLPLWGWGETSLDDPSGRSVLLSAAKVWPHDSREIRIPRRSGCLKKGVSFAKLDLLGVRTARTGFFEAINYRMRYA